MALGLLTKAHRSTAQGHGLTHLKFFSFRTVSSLAAAATVHGRASFPVAAPPSHRQSATLLHCEGPLEPHAIISSSARATKPPLSPRPLLHLPTKPMAEPSIFFSTTGHTPTSSHSPDAPFITREPNLSPHRAFSLLRLHRRPLLAFNPSPSPRLLHLHHRAPFSSITTSPEHSPEPPLKDISFLSSPLMPIIFPQAAAQAKLSIPTTPVSYLPPPHSPSPWPCLPLSTSFFPTIIHLICSLTSVTGASPPNPPAFEPIHATGEAPLLHRPAPSLHLFLLHGRSPLCHQSQPMPPAMKNASQVSQAKLFTSDHSCSHRPFTVQAPHGPIKS